MISLDNYAYELPPEHIAQAPAVPRDAAKLFVYDTATNEVVLDRFWNIAKHLPDTSLLVLNKTKVVPARIAMHKASGGKATLLFLVNEPAGERGREARVIADRHLVPGEALYFPTGEACVVLRKEEKYFVIGLPFGRAGLVMYLERHGSTPIPPYIKSTPLSERELRAKYQATFARESGSAAAPTASLHFTPRVFETLKRKGVERQFITLHVGLGTFAPVSEEHLKTGTLHKEWYEIEARAACAVSEGKNAGRALVAVGTTVVRTLESSVLRSAGKIFFRSGFGKTDIFIRPPYEFRAVDAFITNFHVPRSSLMMLVDAFLAHKGAKRRIRDLYAIAIKEKFRFFSFGDAMLIR